MISITSSNEAFFGTFPLGFIEDIIYSLNYPPQPPIVRFAGDPNFPPPNGAAGELIGEDPAARFESEVAQPGQLLRCIIAKRFSNEVRMRQLSMNHSHFTNLFNYSLLSSWIKTILWYLSKEVESSETQVGAVPGEITQVFSFWAKLMVIGRFGT